MAFEYVIMRHRDNGKPVRASYSIYESYDEAENVMYYLQHPPTNNEYTVSTVAEAERALAALKGIEAARYYVAGRTVSEWQEVSGPMS